MTPGACRGCAGIVRYGVPVTLSPMQLNTFAIPNLETCVCVGVPSSWNGTPWDLPIRMIINVSQDSCVCILPSAYFVQDLIHHRVPDPCGPFVQGSFGGDNILPC